MKRLSVKNEPLVFRWEQRATDDESQPGYITSFDFDAYFAFLEEVKPHAHELREITTYKSPFRLD